MTRPLWRGTRWDVLARVRPHRNAGHRQRQRHLPLPVFGSSQGWTCDAHNLWQSLCVRVTRAAPEPRPGPRSCSISPAMVREPARPPRHFWAALRVGNVRRDINIANPRFQSPTSSAPTPRYAWPRLATGA